MTSRDILKYGAVGFGLEILLIVLFAMMGLGKVTEAIYWPWLLAGNWASPSGAAGHAMPGGAMLGFLIGMIVYALILGAVLRFARRHLSN
jgi:hypothetical protein